MKEMKTQIFGIFLSQSKNFYTFTDDLKEGENYG